MSEKEKTLRGQEIETSEKEKIFRRPLEKSDMERMRIPERFWKASLSKISEQENEDGVSLKRVVNGYLKNFDKLMAEGYGLLLWGKNGVGKTSAAAALAMEARRRCRTVLMISAADYVESMIDNIMFDSHMKIVDRAKNVEMLVMDDFGKVFRDDKGWTDKIFELLFRYRSARLKSNIVTMNYSMIDFVEDCKNNGQPSLIHVLKEILLPIEVAGPDRREENQCKLQDLVLSSEDNQK